MMTSRCWVCSVFGLRKHLTAWSLWVCSRSSFFCQAISEDFLEIAQGLEEELVERAYEFYSPEALRQRWNFLTGNPGLAGAIASSGDPATAAMEQRPGLASTAAGPAWKDPALQELPPLSHFSEDVRDQIKAIMSASGKSHSSEEAEGIANEFSDVNAVEDSDSESELSDSMTDTAMSVFGTNTAMEAEGPEELGYSEPDFPEELDEFLAYCVREHDDDFEVLGL